MSARIRLTCPNNDQKIKTENPLIFSDLRRIIRLQENKNEKSVFRGGLPMKILRITAQGLPLFKKDLDICFYTQQRVYEEDKDSLYRFLANWKWGIRRNITADGVESWWLTWWIS